MNTYKSVIWAMWITAMFGICSCKDNNDSNETVEGVETSCADDAAACQAQELCVFGLCRAACLQNEDCTNGALCLKTPQGAACIRTQDNACLSDSNCPEGLKCLYGRCWTECGTENGIECLPGNTCMDGVCQPNGTGPSSTDAGGRGANPDAGQTKDKDAGQSTPDSGTTAGVCPPNSAQCRGKTVVSCDAQGKARPEQDCAFLCRDGKCAGVCKPGERRCDQKALQNCEPSGEWKTIETCTNVCSPNGCSATCTQGEVKCNDLTLMVCKDGQMTEKEKCPYICKDKACTGECVPGKTDCRNNGVVTCTAEGRWSNRIACQNQNTCVEGVCRDCSPGRKQCVGTAGSYRTCKDNGEWGDEQVCEDKACINGECRGNCSPGAIDCQSDKISYKTCDTDGDWSRTTTKCQNQTCVDDECTGECTPTQKQCKKDSNNKETNVLQTCSDEGTWKDGTVCSGDTPGCMNGECTCTPKAKKCDGETKYQECNDKGSWVSNSCPTNTICTGGVCLTDCSSPHWEKADGNKSIEDPLWAANEAFGTRFASANPPGSIASGEYRILLDRSQEAGGEKGQLVVSIRAKPGTKDVANTNDKVYFGIAKADGSAQAVIISLPNNPQSSPTKPIALNNNFKWSEYKSAWTDISNPGWLKNTYLWTDNNTGSDWSWAINFRVDLTKANLTAQDPSYRIALGMRIDSSSSSTSSVTELFSPASQAGVASFDQLKTNPSRWMRIPPPTSNDCVASMTLY